MTTTTNSLLHKALLAVASLAVLASISAGRAQTGTQVVNFEGLPDGTSGTALSDYLASFGITLTGVTSGVTVQAQTNRPGWAFQASSGKSYLYWGGRNDVWQTFTLNFSQPLTTLSFTRCTELPVNGGTAFPAWSATVYQGTNIVGTAGQAAHSIFSPNTNPAQTYSFTGPGITSVTFAANTANFAGVGSPAIDDIVMSTVPPSSTTVNFDPLPDGTSGSALSDYLAGFGINLSGITPGITLQTQTNRAGWAFQASSPPSYLYWGGRNDVWQSFTLNFNRPLTGLSFTRCTELPVNGGTAFPAWSATVYQGTNIVGTAGQAAHSIFSPNTNPAQTYSFTGTGITSVTFSANTANFAGVGSPAIDDIRMTPVADSATLNVQLYAGLAVAGAVGATYEIQYATSLANPNWQLLAEVTLATSPYLYVDITMPAKGNRFYRAVLKP